MCSFQILDNLSRLHTDCQTQSHIQQHIIHKVFINIALMYMRGLGIAPHYLVSFIYFFHLWFKSDLGQKHYAPQVRPDPGFRTYDLQIMTVYFMSLRHLLQPLAH